MGLSILIDHLHVHNDLVVAKRAVDNRLAVILIRLALYFFESGAIDCDRTQ